VTPRQTERVLRDIQQAIVAQAYVVTPHALLEMETDHLDLVDVESAVLTGKIEQVVEDDPRSRRYEIVGTACDLSTRVGVVVPFAGPWLIITVYEIKA
jgi:hypothetical protein